MAVPHKIECLTGIPCPDVYCEGEIVIRLMDKLSYMHEVAFECNGCLDLWVDKACIEWYV
jgi:hypothetical protein